MAKDGRPHPLPPTTPPAFKKSPNTCHNSAPYRSRLLHRGRRMARGAGFVDFVTSEGAKWADGNVKRAAN